MKLGHWLGLALGLVMAIPLTVVAKTWIEEVAFKDILDKWRSPNYAPKSAAYYDS